MKSRRHIGKTRLLALLVVFLQGLAFVSQAPAADPFVGNIAAIDADSPFSHVTIRRAEKKKEAAAVSGDAVFVGDTVRTYEGVRAQVRLSDGSHILLGPNSRVEMKSYWMDQPAGKRNAALKALAGTIRFWISKAWKDKASGAETRWLDSDVRVETTAAIAGIRGTDFTATVGDADVEIAVFDGVVAVKSSSDSVEGEVLLSANLVSRVVQGAPPGLRTVLTPQMKEKLIRDTTPPKALKSLGGMGVRNVLIGKRGELGIARDLAAGIPLKDIINNAVSDGVKIQEVVAQAVAEGVEPSLVVYTAITEEYAVPLVVSAAITAGAPLNITVNAAIGAGAEKQDIYAGAAYAGVPPTPVANAIVSSAAPAPTVFEYTSPVDPPPGVYTPAAPVVLGGGGGGTPSTRTASPYIKK